MLSRSSSRSQPLPEKISLLLQEARWLILGVMSLYVGLVLIGYNQADPGWSHAADVARVANPGGRFGAWLADLLLYLFGVSSWWWVVFLGYSLLWGFRRIKNRLELDRRSFVFVMIGFLVVLLASSALEFLRFHSHGAAVPLEPGGLLGIEIGQVTQRYFGFTGGRCCCSRCWRPACRCLPASPGSQWQSGSGCGSRISCSVRSGSG